MKKKLAVTAVVALAIALLPFSATPAPAPDADVSNRTTVGIRTATKGQPDDRGRFDYEILPRKSKQDAIAVYNYSVKPVTVRLLPRDAASTPDGEFTAQPSADTPRDVGAWIALSKSELRLAPREMAIVPFQIGVPFNATPGDHTGSILVSLLAKEPKPGSGDVVVEHRVGLRVYLRVPGTITPKLEVRDLATSYTGRWTSLGFGRSVVDYTVRNTGNVRLSSEQQVEMLRSFGLSSRTRKPLGLKELLPGGVAVVHQEFPRTWAVGSVTSKVTLTPAGLDQSVQDVPIVVKETSVFVFPWLIVVLGLMTVLALGGWVRHRRRRRSAPTGRRSSGTGPGAPVEDAELVTAGTAAGKPGKRRLNRTALAFAGALALVGLSVASAPTAQALDGAPTWKATVVERSGGADDPIELKTSGGCPQPADSILAKVYGKGFGKDGKNVIGNTKAGVTQVGPFPAPIAFSMKEFMSQQPDPIALQGTYRFVVTCRTAKLPRSYGDYVAEIKFTSPTTWVAAKPVTTKTGPVLKLDENGHPILPTPGASGSHGPNANPSAGSSTADLPGNAAAASDGSPALTASQESDGAMAYVLIIGGVAVAAVTGFFLWRRSSS